MRKHWWKVLGVVLMIFVLIAGFLMPLKPGITAVSPQNFEAGKEVVFNISTYNAKLADLEAEDIRVWLRNDTSYIIASKKVSILDDQHMNVSFDIPEFLPSNDSIAFFSMIVDGPGIGSFILPSSIFISQKSIDFEVGKDLWTVDKLEGLNSFDGFGIPFRNILLETLRNTYFHVSLWFSMFILFLISVVYSIKYLRNREINHDIVASSLVEIGTLYGVLGLITGAIWAKNTWGTYWTTDVKLNMAAISMMIYAAYLVLRMSISDQDKRAIISSSYNIFAFFIIIPLIFVIPRLTDSLHPGNGGNPGFGGDDMDSTMRMVFYPAILAFTLLALWIAELIIRIKVLREKLEERNNK